MELYLGTSRMRNCTLPGPYRRPMPGVLEGSWGGRRFLMGEVPVCVNLSNVAFSSLNSLDCFRHDVNINPQKFRAPLIS
jgi:hypothetical protein